MTNNTNEYSTIQDFEHFKLPDNIQKDIIAKSFINYICRISPKSNPKKLRYSLAFNTWISGKVGDSTSTLVL